jgi:hypothetical protein
MKDKDLPIEEFKLFSENVSDLLDEFVEKYKFRLEVANFIFFRSINSDSTNSESTRESNINANEAEVEEMLPILEDYGFEEQKNYSDDLCDFFWLFFLGMRKFSQWMYKNEMDSWQKPKIKRKSH